MTCVSQNETRYEHVPRAEFERRLRDAGDMPEVSGLRRRADGHGGHPKYTYLGQGRRPYAVAVPNAAVAKRVTKLPDASQLFDAVFFSPFGAAFFFGGIVEPSG